MNFLLKIDENKIKHLKAVLQNPFDATEYLSISNNVPNMIIA